MRPPALVLAARERDVTRMRELLAEGADVNEADDYGITALMSACLRD